MDQLHQEFMRQSTKYLVYNLISNNQKRNSLKRGCNIALGVSGKPVADLPKFE